MSILGLTTPTLTSTSTSTTTDSKSLSGNFDMFLNLLVTQMQTQDPLNPMDTSTFTTQLVQYSSVEQQIKMNANLADLKALLTTQSAANLVGYIGKTVSADASTTSFDGTTKANWTFTSSAAASSATVTVENAAGETVYTGTQKLTKGENTFAWSGNTTTGGTAPAGRYKLTVSGKDANGDKVSITSAVTGVVQSVDFTGDTPMLTVDGQTISAYAVTQVAAGS